MSELEIKPAIFLFANVVQKDFYEIHYLALTAGYKMKYGLTQKIKKVDKTFYFGKGKIAELVSLSNSIENKEAPILINVSINATQKRNIEEITNRKVIDRVELIFLIFKNGAKTAEAKLQVEIAELKYMASRMVDEEANYSQVTSGSGHNKGSGEKQKELTRREISNAIKQKERQLESIKKARKTGRKRRNQSDIPVISVVGYTNAGKSTLVNALIDYSKKKPGKEVFVKDQMFATLETSSRLIDVYGYPSFIISDTVGFVSNLPHFLVAAFRSTLEEIKESDYIIEVVDLSSQYITEDMEIAESILEELEANTIPRIVIYNKSDNSAHHQIEPKFNEIVTSLNNKDNIQEVFTFIMDNITSTWVRKIVTFPHGFDFRVFAKDNYIVSKIIKKDGIECLVYFNPKLLYKYESYFSN